MQTKRKCQIYEFSRKFLEPKWSKKLDQYVTTGFDKEIGWETKKVPKEIANLVYNNGFRINDNYPPQKEAIALIAREIEKYAILAVATDLVDDSDRPLVAYRYFWLEKPPKNNNIDGIGTLLIWWIEQNYPYFKLNPSAEYQNHKKSHQGSLLYKKDLLNFYKLELQFLFKKIPQNSHNYTINFSLYEKTLNDPGVLHSLALLLNKEYNSPINWAFNIDKLESPDQFTLIYTTTYSQYQLIVNNLNQLSETSASFSNETLTVSTDSQLKRCLIELARNKNLDGNFLKLANYLKEVDSYYWQWEGILDQTILKDNHDITTARYRALLAILKPSPEISNWLDWLGKLRNESFRKAGINSQHQLLEFLESQQILDKSKIDNKIDELLLWNLSNRKNNTNHTIKEREWLLIKSKSFWGKYFQETAQYYTRVLVYNLKKSDDSVDQFCQQILSDWKTCKQNQSLSPDKQSDYELIAELFAQVKSYSLAAFFYQLSWGKVPADIYNKAEIIIIPLEKSSRSSGLIVLAISNIKEDIKLLLANLISMITPV